MEHIDSVVIGAGMVGLAVARALAMAGHEVIILEKEAAIGTETSARNSEVIHGGIYYPKGSLKAELCVNGRHALYRYCEAHGVSHKRCGKLIVATTDNEIRGLEELQAHGLANGVDDLRMLSGAQAKALEHRLHCVAALFSPSTGIIDSHGLMLAYQGEAQDHGAMLALESQVNSCRVLANGIELDVGGAEPMQIVATNVINSAGLHAPGVASRIEGLPAQYVPTAHYAKGNYFTLAGRAPFSRLIYPMPEAAGLGVHLTLDLAGQARFGPDVEWIDGIDYSIDPARCQGFYAAIRTYWPELPDDALQPAYAGIRPKIYASNEAARDFVIDGPSVHGVPGLINLFGIESPGLTSSLAIAERVMSLLKA